MPIYPQVSTISLLLLLQVRVHANNPEGVVTVKFKQEEPAQTCVAKMNGRFFGGNKLVAHMWDGYTSYHVSNCYLLC